MVDPTQITTTTLYHNSCDGASETCRRLERGELMSEANW